MAVTINGSTGVGYADNIKHKLGTSDDLQIYHDGSHSYLSSTSHEMRIQSEDVRFRNAANNKTMLYAHGDAGVELYHNNSKVFETLGNGVRAQGGIMFGSDTADANRITDYEEGSFSLTVTPDSGSYTYGHGNTGYYVKVGRLVHINVWVHLTVSSPSGDITLGGFPFTVKNTNRRQRLPITGYGWSSVSNSSIIMARLTQNGTTANMHVTNDSYSSTSGVTASNLGQSSEIYINASYLTE